MENDEIIQFLETCPNLKPKDLIIDDLSWKYLIRAVLRSKNTLIIGPTRCGKTKAVQTVVRALNKEDRFFYFNLGSTQDARATLIGNTMFKKELGTMFHESQFVKAIRTEGAVILLDELSRGHHDAWNILMPVLDSTQRYLRLDETEESSIVPVADGVTFVATANIGNEYTATKVLDKALTSRFPVIVEMKLLDDMQEFALLKHMFPQANKIQSEEFRKITKISHDTKVQCRMTDSRITNFISTAAVLDMAELILDGFTINEIVEVSVYPLYSEDGGAESERIFVKQLVQKYVPLADVKSPINDPARQKHKF